MLQHCWGPVSRFTSQLLSPLSGSQPCCFNSCCWRYRLVPASVVLSCSHLKRPRRVGYLEHAACASPAAWAPDNVFFLTRCRLVTGLNCCSPPLSRLWQASWFSVLLKLPRSQVNAACVESHFPCSCQSDKQQSVVQRVLVPPCVLFIARTLLSFSSLFSLLLSSPLSGDSRN